MKSFRWFRMARQSATGPKTFGPGTSDRQGSTIVVVIALLLALTFLGIVGYTIGTQEQSNAEYFSDAAKSLTSGPSRDTLFDWSLRQIILGTRLEERQSALHGGHMSLMATLFGSDLAPYTGNGVHLGLDSATDNIFVDQDYDGADDSADYLLEMNRTPFSGGAAPDYAVDQANYPAPDAGYTYWDNNSPFLAYVNTEHVYDVNGNTLGVILPSFHRPPYLRSMGVAANQWYTDPTTQRRVLRPHVEHRAVDVNGTVTDTKRFVSTAADATALGLANPFPFPSNTPGVINDGVWEASDGPTALTNSANVKYDADPDGDGINEAIWLDLDFPMQIRENADGTVTKFVPMFAPTIIDADALLNLNAHGNLAGIDPITFNFFPPGTKPFNNNSTDVEFLSQSNEGVSVSEVNPLWGLTASPGNAVELANQEWWWLMTGRADVNAGVVQNLYPGRYGEINDLDTAITADTNYPPANPFAFPKPGLTFFGGPSAFNPTNSDDLRTDDNLTAKAGGAFSDTTMLGITPPPIQVNRTVFPASINFEAWEHPLDLHGAGKKTNPAAANAMLGKERMRYQPPGSLYNWPAYDNYQTTADIGLRSTSYANNLMQNFSRRYNVDEPEETLLEPVLSRSDLDAIFGDGENATLHLPQADQDLLGITGRLRNLAPMNFDDAADVAATEARRRRFTTTSWDLKSIGRSVFGVGGAADKFRNWEFSGDGDNDGSQDFPPSFGSTLNTAQDPFRSELRALLTTNVGGRQSLTLQRKLSINHVLDRDANGRLRFRPLTPHPKTGLSADPVQSTDTAGVNYTTKPATPDTAAGPRALTVADQEWLARYDRQRLCRDIYVLLYTLGGGNDATNYTSGSYPDNDSDNLRDDPKLMAQFAVNLVDRMDTDDVITVFEYDQDLSNGWNLDDDAFDDTDATAPNERQIVFGVEQQQLVLNESQILIAKRVVDSGMTAQNHEATEYDDQKNRDWTFIELENVTPTNQSFGNGAWQLVLKADPNYVANPAVPFTVNEKRLTLLGNWTIGNGTNSRLTIGTAGDLENRGADMGTQHQAPAGQAQPSFFRVDPDFNPTGGTMPTHKDAFNMAGFATDPAFKIAPRGTLNVDLNLATTTPSTDYSVHTGDFPIGTGNGNDFFSHTGDDKDMVSAADALDQLQPGMVLLQVELRRRINPYRTAATNQLESDDNPWVTVDETEENRLGLDVFELQDDDEYVEIRNQLRQVNSSERAQPLAPTLTEYNGTPPDYKQNTFGTLNQVGSTASFYTEYQPHFDRDFSSPVELLSVPLYGPDQVVTESLTTENVTTPPIDASPARFKIAAHKFLRPDFPDGVDASADYDNRWHRLFGFIEVPDRSHRHPAQIATDVYARSPFILDVGEEADLVSGIPADLGFYRRPGRVQLNTLRYPEVLGGLLDDPEVIQLDPDSTNSLHLQDQHSAAAGGSDPNRDWWVQFVQSRDGIDSMTNMFLPGLPTAKPFQSLSFSALDKSSLEHTLLRKLPQDNQRLLFELGSSTQHSSGSVDHTLRHRMLAKVLNNSTNRSNVFLIFVQVDFFEAVEVTDPGTGENVVRVGGILSDTPGYRGFFVVDRSKVVDQLSQLMNNDPNFDPAMDFLPSYFHDPQDPASDPNDNTTWKFNYSFNQDFNFRSMILHRQTIN